jgi:hypothetical protein
MAKPVCQLGLLWALTEAVIRVPEEETSENFAEIIDLISKLAVLLPAPPVTQGGRHMLSFANHQLDDLAWCELAAAQRCLAAPPAQPAAAA